MQFFLSDGNIKYMPRSYNNIPKGFGLIVLLASLFIIVIIMVGGFYMGNLQGQRSTIDVGREALKRTSQLQEMVNNRQRLIEENGQVRLDLSNQGLSKMPSYILDMIELESLDLSGNKLTGALPAEIRYLSNLKELNVSHNSMTGIPAEIGALKNLETLDYSYNGITGMPNELSQLKNLKTFNLTGNNFSKQDLNTITTQLSNLKVIY